MTDFFNDLKASLEEAIKCEHEKTSDKRFFFVDNFNRTPPPGIDGRDTAKFIDLSC